MKILVYGAGGVGAFFGGLLARAGQDVHFVARGAQLEALRTGGLTIRSTLLGELTVPRVSAAVSAGEIGPADLILVCVKTHQTKEILDDLAAAVRHETVIVPLQNGVESDELLAERFGAERVLPAVVYVGATVEAPGVVSHVAAGRIGIGTRGAANAERVERIRAALATTGQPIHVADDIQRERWHKLMWNAAFNTVSALTGLDPIDLLARRDTRGVILGIMREVLEVGRAGGVNLHDRDIDEQVAWTEGAHGLRTSTLVDRERGRTMESDALIGVIVRRGRDAGVPTPRAEVVHALLQALDVSAPRAGAQP